ncbi:hypothetical protein IWZ01DRAFT_316299 [Phyllosticta capitalensis]
MPLGFFFQTSSRNAPRPSVFSWNPVMALFQLTAPVSLSPVRTSPTNYYAYRVTSVLPLSLFLASILATAPERLLPSASLELGPDWTHAAKRKLKQAGFVVEGEHAIPPFRTACNANDCCIYMTEQPRAYRVGPAGNSVRLKSMQESAHIRLCYQKPKPADMR